MKRVTGIGTFVHILDAEATATSSGNPSRNTMGKTDKL